MKAKQIIILYVNNGNMQSQIAKEHLFQRVLGQLLSEGRIASNTNLGTAKKSVKFEDGSSIVTMPIGRDARGLRCTHMYVDQNISMFDNGQEVLLHCKDAVIKGEHLNFDTSEPDRFFTFTFDDGLQIHKQ